MESGSLLGAGTNNWHPAGLHWYKNGAVASGVSVHFVDERDDAGGFFDHAPEVTFDAAFGALVIRTENLAVNRLVHLWLLPSRVPERLARERCGPASGLIQAVTAEKRLAAFSTALASFPSNGLSPPTEWVDRTISTLFQTLVHSGWWSIFSA